MFLEVIGQIEAEFLGHDFPPALVVTSYDEVEAKRISVVESEGIAPRLAGPLASNCLDVRVRRLKDGLDFRNRHAGLDFGQSGVEGYWKEGIVFAT